MAAADNCKFQREQGGDVINILTGHVFKFNSTQLPAINSVTTAVTSSLAGVVAGFNTFAGEFNTLKLQLSSLGINATT